MHVFSDKKFFFWGGGGGISKGFCRFGILNLIRAVLLCFITCFCVYGVNYRYSIN